MPFIVAHHDQWLDARKPDTMASLMCCVTHRDQAMKQKLTDGITRLCRRLLRMELLFTVCPVVLFPSAAMILMLIYPAAGLSTAARK